MIVGREQFQNDFTKGMAPDLDPKLMDKGQYQRAVNLGIDVRADGKVIRLRNAVRDAQIIPNIRGLCTSDLTA